MSGFPAVCTAWFILLWKEELLAQTGYELEADLTWKSNHAVAVLPCCHRRAADKPERHKRPKGTVRGLLSGVPFMSDRGPARTMRDRACRSPAL